MRYLFLLCGCLTVTLIHAQSNSFFLSHPTLTPDGKTIIFAFEGDLWKAGPDQQASRLTAMQGYETTPRVSPDGKWIAFTGRQYGNADVFVIPTNGGEVKQITYNSTGDEVSGWSWDSKYIYFNSGRMGQLAGFKVAATGGTAQRVFGTNFFQYDHNLIEHPSGEIFFNDTWESNNQAQRKRYRGPFNPDIQSFNPQTKKYKRYTNWEGKDFATTIDRKGNVYFVSDEGNNEFNLYTITNETKKALTNFPNSVRNPQVNADGGTIVFEKDYQLWSYDVKNAQTKKLTIDIVRNSTLPKEKDFDVKTAINEFDVSPDSKKLAFISRGELFVSDVEGKFIQQVKRDNGERVHEVHWMADNKSLLFNQTVKGYPNWFKITADGKGQAKQITNDERNDRALIFNKDRSKAAYESGRGEIRIMDMKSMEVKTVVKDEIWSMGKDRISFSPNDEYLACTVRRNFEEDILLYNFKTNTTINITNTGVTETSPIWSPDGKYIYFLSNRLKPTYPTGLNDARIYKMALEKFDEPYRTDKFDDLFKEEKKDTSKKAPVVSKAITIDQDGLMDRLELVGPASGNQFLIDVLQKNDKTTIVYVSDHLDGRPTICKTVIEPFEVNKTEKISGTEGAFSFDLAGSNDKYFASFNGGLYKVNLDANRVDPIAISYVFRRNLQSEFAQIFDEAWAQIDANYYDEEFHGIDWKKTRNYYAQYIPYLNTRADLRILLNDMLGDLNSSHQGFSTSGTDEAITLRNTTMETGILFDQQSPYKVKSIVKRTVSDRKGIDVQPGDVLVEVNNMKVDPKMDRDYYFTQPSLDKEIALVFKRGESLIPVKIHPQPSIFSNLYDEWIAGNKAYVHQKTKAKIAYGYMKDMGRGELDKFLIDMTNELADKDALIMDLRYNTGGNVHDALLQFLSQKSYLQWKYREGKMTAQPNFAPSDKPIILLINEQSLSDAEMTAQGFKQLKLGKIIGNGTYRWIIFTNGVQLVDGSFVRLPSWGCYTLDGKDLEKTGVQPDITVINTFEDKLNGRDPQLDKAIEEIMKQIK